MYFDRETQSIGEFLEKDLMMKAVTYRRYREKTLDDRDDGRMMLDLEGKAGNHIENDVSHGVDIVQFRDGEMKEKVDTIDKTTLKSLRELAVCVVCLFVSLTNVDNDLKESSAKDI